MGKDIQVYTALVAKVRPAERLDILLLSTEGAAPMRTYTSLKEIQRDFSGKKVAAMAERMFHQSHSLAGALIRKVRIAGIEAPQDVEETEDSEACTKAEGLVKALEDVRDMDDSFYFLLTDVTDEACVTALCAWAENTEPNEAALGAGVEDHRKFYFGQVSSKSYSNTYGRSAVIYSDNPEKEWADAAWVGCTGPFWPEGVTWKWKTPDGVAAADLRDSERDVLENNRVNFMTAEYKHEYVKNGICGDGNFIDNIVGADYITYQMRENLYQIFLSNPNIGYTDAGFAVIASGVYRALNQAVELHIIALDPETRTGVYSVAIPRRADATDEQVRSRIMPDIGWEAQLEGAVHGAKVRGTLQVTLNG